ncbi:TolC family protein [Desulfovibrio sp. JC022]|uniref:TolC family protein n=1 Tax=Desulfovibrio sp. JC022 TaxID=2593642 RepID=UPI0013D4010F|nr:TolC family protein [Desulfovibrio sp. JC022]NDV21341.1 TolC family protein [Desulfovibrio sp. JC022]
MRTNLKILLLSIVALLALCGCKRNYSHSEATTGTDSTKTAGPDKWAGSVMDSGTVKDGWIHDFKDAQLDMLVAEAMKNNPNLQASAAKVDQANALAKQAGAALLPTVGLGGQLAGTTAGGTARPQGAGLGISWEADVWGRLGLGERSAEESAKAVQADYEFGRQSLAAATARNWFLLNEIEVQQDFLKSIVDILEKMNTIESRKQKVGKVSMMEVHQVHAQLASAKDTATKAEQAREEAARSLETLIGRYPSNKLKGADKLAATPPPIPVGQPSSILERRPDIIAAEDRVAAAFYAQKGAELLHLPRFTFGGGGGINALGDAIAGLTAGLFAPLYTGGEIEAEVEQATAVQKEAIANYASAALNAFKEVENGLAGEKLLKEREAYLAQAAADNKKTFELAQIQYKVGKIDLFELLSHQTRWIGSEMSLLNVRRERLDNRINLHLALGGSFE